MSKRAKVWMISAVGVLIVVAVGIVLYLPEINALIAPQCPLNHITPADVARVQVREIPGGPLSGAAEYVVEGQQAYELLRTLTPAEADLNPLPWTGLAVLKIELVGGEYTAEVYDAGDGPAAFSIARHYYRGGDERAFLEALKRSRPATGPAAPGGRTTD